MSWIMGEDGYPTNTDFVDLPAEPMSPPYPHLLWRITSGVNDGLPYNALTPLIDLPTEVRLRLDGLKFKKTTETEYDQMTEYDPDTVYILVGSNNIWNGSVNNKLGTNQVKGIYCGDELIWATYSYL